MKKKELLKMKGVIFKNGEYQYIGILKLPTMPKLIRHFYGCWAAEGTRCNNKKCIDYPNYGIKGVKRIWSSRECINWCLNEYVKVKSWINPVIARLGDKGNYEPQNCKLIENSINSKEAYRSEEHQRKFYAGAAKSQMKKIELIPINRGKKIIFESAVIGARALGKNRLYLSCCATKKMPAFINGEKYIVKYVEASDAY